MPVPKACWAYPPAPVDKTYPCCLLVRHCWKVRRLLQRWQPDDARALTASQLQVYVVDQRDACGMTASQLQVNVVDQLHCCVTEPACAPLYDRMTLGKRFWKNALWCGCAGSRTLQAARRAPHWSQAAAAACCGRLPCARDWQAKRADKQILPQELFITLKHH